MYVNSTQIEQARKADLHAFLRASHPDLFCIVGHSICLKANKSLYIKEGYCGYQDFSSGETGGGITFLVKYLGYGFQEAVVALCGHLPHETLLPDTSTSCRFIGTRSITLPVPAPLPQTRMYAFLMERGIPKPMINTLVSANLLYQSADKNNVVFVNRERDYCELRGTYTFAQKPFHGCLKTRSDRFWYFTGGKEKPETAYITEAAIDAISLCLIHLKEKRDISKRVYISIGGVNNHAAITRVKRGIRTILAVDNDRAGDLCRHRHRDIDAVIPQAKDWNDDWKAMMD